MRFRYRLRIQIRWIRIPTSQDLQYSLRIYSEPKTTSNSYALVRTYSCEWRENAGRAARRESILCRLYDPITRDCFLTILLRIRCGWFLWQTTWKPIRNMPFSVVIWGVRVSNRFTWIVVLSMNNLLTYVTNQ